MATNYKDIVNNQRGLADHVRDEQRRQAQANFDQGQRGVSEQLRQARQVQQKNRQQLSEQSYLAQRQNQQGATSRGLGSSGLRDLGALQNQITQGRAVSELAQIDSQVQREALNTKLGLSDNLAGALGAAETQHLQANVDADRFGLDQQYRQSELLTQFAQMLNDGMDEKTLESFLKLSGFTMDDIINVGTDAEGNPVNESLGGILGNLGNSGVGAYGDTNFDNKGSNFFDMDDFEGLETVNNWAGLNWWTDPNTGVTYKRGRDETTGYGVYLGSDGSKKYKFKINNQKHLFSQEEAGAYMKDLFKGKQYIGEGADDIQIVPHKDGKGWGFSYKGTIHKTYNKAATKRRDQDVKNKNATQGN